jgi:hypothetical protein
MYTLAKYLPTSDADKLIWFNNFSGKIATYAALVGISAAEITSVRNDFAAFQYMVNLLESYRQTLNNITSYKNLLKHASGTEHLGVLPTAPVFGTAPTAVAEGVFDRITKLAARIKSSLNYTESMGHDLGIISASTVIDVNALQPNLIVKLDVGRPHIKCVKSPADALDLYVDRREGEGFRLIGRLLKTDYIDTTGLPATTPLVEWDYKAMYVIGNDQVGLMSQVTSILVKRM